ncbi:hypothetical protein QTJ16_006395 [Diplocarpon rosae]|uniref:Ras-associating domain-containing protein n=1 Tax=Diplocarpon rosae TaxID=946125 RepID=A0AAD9SVH3_9HELO|nr:hypothetical protein QTJ16_006395 [Diplocarpon rosae]
MNENTEKYIGACRSVEKLPTTTAVTSVSQRMKDNQKQKSLRAITKWAVFDKKKFDQKLKKLKGLADGLEEVSKAANITRKEPRAQSLVIHSRGHPPSYSFGSLSLDRIRDVATPAITPYRRGYISRQEREFAKHYGDLKLHAKPFSHAEESRRIRTQEKLLKLTDTQLDELQVDVYDELCRRDQDAASPPFLQHNLSYHSKRNQARQEISSLPSHRFQDLIMDLVFELERRFSFLRSQIFPEVELASHLSDPFSTPRNSITRRYNSVFPPGSPHLAAHRTLNHVYVATHLGTRPRLVSRFSQSSTAFGNMRQSMTTIPRADAAALFLAQGPISSTSSEISKSLPVSMEDTTLKVLPKALKKYNINAPWKQYTLYIVYSNKERCLGMDEKPLVLFKKLENEGKAPIFILRKTSSAMGAPTEPNPVDDSQRASL